MIISIVYDSGYGHTQKQAEAVAAGARSVSDSVVNLIPVKEGNIPWSDLEKSDAIIFGSPTYNGLISARLKQFFEDSTKEAWTEFKWRNKIAAGFTNSGSLSGDKLNSLISMALFAAQHGMIWAGLDLHPANPDSPLSTKDLNGLGSWLGAMAFSENDSPEVTPGEKDLKTAEYLGKRVAEVTARFISTI
ncbi:flavodoxin family protein [Flavobacterium sp. MC2016-06]|jgi:NAD(P)H dehydrogenase (quinone)|uniref:flavodoxin family protein n=1 Tax=Flavobacterium sp. MC2016-06 TaxID=2676308 RepID=UPI0012BAD2DD|nr:flavodoxin family protein [Flavobacterium sp. MC2016-06]MBU3857599.1 flavodoxin family protein [Flavobacterium sp. MC2016-06]